MERDRGASSRCGSRQRFRGASSWCTFMIRSESRPPMPIWPFRCGRQNGHVFLELSQLGKDLPSGHELWTELSYLERHGTEGHLDYVRFRRRGVPLGSGAIESAIRRVINLRLKGNSISWYEKNAEGMLLLRCLVLSKRWDDTFAQISASLASNRCLDWTFRSPDMPSQLEAKITIEPPKPQPSTESTTCDAAA